VPRSSGRRDWRARSPADRRRRLGARQDGAPVERLGRKHRGGVLRPQKAGPRRESAERGRHAVGRVPDLLRDLPHRGQSGLRDQPDLAPALVVPLDQLGPGRQDPRRAPRRAALRRRAAAGSQRAREGRRHSGPDHQHHPLQQRPPPRADAASAGSVHLRFHRGSRPIAPRAGTHLGPRGDQPHALGPTWPAR